MLALIERRSQTLIDELPQCTRSGISERCHFYPTVDQCLLRRMIQVADLTNDSASMAAIWCGYNPALRHMQRHTRLSTGFAPEILLPDLTDPTAPQSWSKLDYGET